MHIVSKASKLKRKRTNTVSGLRRDNGARSALLLFGAVAVVGVAIFIVLVTTIISECSEVVSFAEFARARLIRSLSGGACSRLAVIAGRTEQAAEQAGDHSEENAVERQDHGPDLVEY